MGNRASARSQRLAAAMGVTIPSRRSRKAIARANGNGGGNNSRKSGFFKLQRGQGAIAQNDSSTILQHAAPQLSDVLEKDEYVADVVGSGGTGNLAITAYAFNPGQSAMFPLGSAEAAKWTNWRCVYAEPYLLHEVSEFATDGSTGKLVLAMDYNSANAAPTTKQQLEDMHSASCMPCQDVGLKLIPRLLNRADPKYIRVAGQPGGTDLRLYDGGNFYVAAIGQAGTTKVAELRIRYKFTLELPTLLNPTAAYAPGSQLIISDNQLNLAGATTVQKLMFSSAATVNVINGIGATIASTGLVTLPAGLYLVEGTVTGVNQSASVTTAAMQFVNTTTLTNYLFTSPNSVTSSGEPSQVESTSYGSFVLQTPNAGAVVGMSAALTYASGTCWTAGVMRITKLSNP